MSTRITRRTFMKVIGSTGAGFALGGFASLGCGRGKDQPSTFSPNAFVEITPGSEKVRISVTKAEMGQGVRTACAMLVAEEMDADWDLVEVVQAPGDGKVYGTQATGGSSSISSMHKHLREMGASARQMLIAAAAKTWNVDPATCSTEAGQVHHTKSGKTATYSSLASLAATMPVPDPRMLRLKKKEEFKILGRRTNRVDNPAVVSGTAIYGLDVQVDGMVFAALARPYPNGSAILDVDESATRKVPGVIDVVKLAYGVAVVAENTWAAFKGRDALKFKKKPGPNEDISTAKILEAMKKEVIPHPSMPADCKVIEATFDLPYLAHVCMEPLNALADVRPNHCEIWSGTQAPDDVQVAVAKQLQLPRRSVKVNAPLLGGGFGRRGGDYIAKAVDLSKAINKPVKLVWTREDDILDDAYRPMGHHSLKGAIDSKGQPVAWSHQAIEAGGRHHNEDGNPALRYAVKEVHMRRSSVPCGIPVGSWRSTEFSSIIAANECFIDELAHAAGRDPFEFRLEYLVDSRFKRVLEVAAHKGNWGTALPKGSGRGIAFFGGYNSYVAHVIEVTVGESIRVDRVVSAVDCGLPVNPSGIEALMQGACCDGLSTALGAEITIEKGLPVQTNFDSYKWMTMRSMPKVEVEIIDSSVDPGGMGETGYPSVSPALANAVFAATGKRVRKFPIRVNELV